jgi:hypothetical protein
VKHDAKWTTRLMGKWRWLRTRVKGDGGKRRFERGRLRTRVMRESEADGLVGWLRPRMKGDGEAGL